MSVSCDVQQQCCVKWLCKAVINDDSAQQHTQESLLDVSLCTLAVVSKEEVSEGKVASSKDACHLQKCVNLCDKQKGASQDGANANQSLVGCWLTLHTTGSMTSSCLHQLFPFAKSFKVTTLYLTVCMLQAAGHAGLPWVCAVNMALASYEAGHKNTVP